MRGVPAPPRLAKLRQPLNCAVKASLDSRAVALLVELTRDRDHVVRQRHVADAFEPIA